MISMCGNMKMSIQLAMPTHRNIGLNHMFTMLILMGRKKFSSEQTGL